ncbi:uncharacterized protein LOC114442836 isoform X2 [Parambassis ranga]|nr:uncharacterized protein LOC114442836 isoform X2 [Parambassis ranga]XP_028272446.1 uncharacterized protein LOC114442836 isoform X2 [Parambassis ranga]
MSQSHNPADTQALLQSMLQRLKLQPGRDGQAYLHTPAPTLAASTLQQGGERAAFNPHKVNSNPVSDFGVNGVTSKECGLSAVDSNFGRKGDKIQRAGRGCEVDSGLVSFSSQKDNNHGDLGEKRKATWPVVTPTGTGQLLPAKSVKDADITSFQRTDGERGGSGGTRHITPGTDNALIMGPNQDHGFTPKVYMWSLKNTDVDAGGQQYKQLREGNGGTFAQSKDEETVSDMTRNSFRRKQRSSENKTRRWTQRIKERWKDRSGSFGKKGKEEGGSADQRSEHRNQISPPDQVLEKNEERSLASQENSTKLPTQPEDSNKDGPNRSTSDFDFGLGSFSLLEEIVTGQEWAKFLNPNLTVPQRTSEDSQSQPQIQTTPPDFNQSSAVLNPFGGGSNQWSFRSTEASPPTVFSAVRTDASLPMSMDVSEGKQSGIHREVDQTEPMEDMQAGQRRQTFTPPSLVETADNLQNSVLKSRVHLNRKRQHQPAESRGERLQAGITSEGAQTDREHLTSSLRINSITDETGESGCEKLIPLYNFNCHPTPLSPSSSNPLPPAPRGVLKHSISQDSESSMGTMTKRRRVEENRRVRFSEEVVAIASADLELDATDSEEDSDSGPEEDSMTEQDCVVEQAAVEEVVPSRRPALTAWMRVLKRKNTGRKPRL